MHTEGEEVRLRWTHVVCGAEGSAPCGRWHRKVKLEPTGIILSSHAKKMECLFARISSLDVIKSGNFRPCKLLIYITNTCGIVWNKLHWYYRLISALALEGHCTSCFSKVRLCILCRRHVDKRGEGPAHVDKGRRLKKSRFLWMS